jgi:hypothetical protein
MGEKRKTYKVFLRKREGNRPLARLTHRWEDNINLKLINTDLRKIGGESMDWIYLD